MPRMFEDSYLSGIKMPPVEFYHLLCINIYLSLFRVVCLVVLLYAFFRQQFLYSRESLKVVDFN
jgi:hypothetical protein